MNFNDKNCHFISRFLSHITDVKTFSDIHKSSFMSDPFIRMVTRMYNVKHDAKTNIAIVLANSISWFDNYCLFLKMSEGYFVTRPNYGLFFNPVLAFISEPTLRKNVEPQCDDTKYQVTDSTIRSYLKKFGLNFNGTSFVVLKRYLENKYDSYSEYELHEMDLIDIYKFCRSWIQNSAEDLEQVTDFDTMLEVLSQDSIDNNFFIKRTYTIESATRLGKDVLSLISQY